MYRCGATDVEVLEARLPLRAWRLSLRPESGGAGRHRGGDGLIRELELLSDGTASLLASSKDFQVSLPDRDVPGRDADAGGVGNNRSRVHLTDFEWVNTEFY